MRRAAQVDANQPDIVKQLRQCGVQVQSLAAVGEGVPDLLCGFRGVNVLLEIKDPAQDPCKRQLNALQREWHGKWSGPVKRVETFTEAMDFIVSVTKQEYAK